VGGLALLALLALLAAACCAALVPLVRRLALATGALDIPAERSIHPSPTPRLGGLAVLAAFVIVVAIAAGAGLLGGGARPQLPAFFAGALLVAAVGAIDDLRRLRATIKLAVEIVAAVLVVYLGGCRFEGISGPGGVIGLGALAAPFTVVWIVLVTNAVNLVDGIDGLAAGTAGIALVAVAVIALGFDLPAVGALAAILAGACLGFLFHNFHPASIFLGDSWSLFIGFTLGVLSTYARAKGTTGAITLATILIVALPLGDALWAVERRYVKGLAPQSLRSHLAGLARIFRPDRNHLHHRLLRAGLDQRAASYALYGIQAIACATAVYLLVRG
jgi:UDP-GlcNAc:undecaprenyl-phosphate/decaprenyl-phosphate GlcNAc-1-phosphate transferase